MKTTYSTITLRYVHDVVTGEFANIGVVLYAPEQRLLEARFTQSYERLKPVLEADPIIAERRRTQDALYELTTKLQAKVLERMRPFHET